MVPPHANATKAALARWMGYETAAAMDAQHDFLHASLCRWLGVPSHSLLSAARSDHDPVLAALEEDAVLHLQRFIAHSKIEVPK